MRIDASKLLFLKGSTAASAVKVGVPMEMVSPDPSKVLVLKGSEAARSAKVSAPEPVITD